MKGLKDCQWERKTISGERFFRVITILFVPIRSATSSRSSVAETVSRCGLSTWAEIT